MKKIEWRYVLPIGCQTHPIQQQAEGNQLGKESVSAYGGGQRHRGI